MWLVSSLRQCFGVVLRIPALDITVIFRIFSDCELLQRDVVGNVNGFKFRHYQSLNFIELFESKFSFVAAAQDTWSTLRRLFLIVGRGLCLLSRRRTIDVRAGRC